MILRDKKKLWLIAIPVLLIVVLKLMEKARRPPLLPGLGGYPTAIAFSPDAKTIVCATSNGLVSKWMPDKSRWRSFQNAKSPHIGSQLQVFRLRFSPDGKALYGGGARFSSVPAYKWSVATRRYDFIFNYVNGSAFDVSPNGRWAALSDSTRGQLVDLQGAPLTPYTSGFATVARWRRLPSRVVLATSFVSCVAFSPDSKILAVALQNASLPLALWDVQTAKQLPAPRWGRFSTSSGPASELLAMEWSPDGKRLAALGGGNVLIYDLTMGSFIEAVWPTPHIPRSGRMISKAEEIPSLAWSPDGKWLFTGGDEVRQWDATDLNLKRSFKTAGPVAVSPDGKTLATANRPDMAEPSGVRLVPL